MHIHFGALIFSYLSIVTVQRKELVKIYLPGTHCRIFQILKVLGEVNITSKAEITSPNVVIPLTQTFSCKKNR